MYLTGNGRKLVSTSTCGKNINREAPNDLDAYRSNHVKKCDDAESSCQNEKAQLKGNVK